MNNEYGQQVSRTTIVGFVPIVFCVLVLLVFQIEALPGAQFKIEPGSIEFGNLTSTSKVQKRAFTVTNIGTTPLEFDFAGTTCRCTRVEAFDKNILPGHTREVVMAMNPAKGQKGWNSQTVFFSTSDPEHPLVSMNISWRMKLDDVAVAPEMINVELSHDEISNGLGNSHNSIVIYDTWEKRLEIKDIQTSAHLITGLYDITYRCPRGTQVHMYRFKTQLLPDTPVGSINEWLKFSTNHPAYTSITIPITGKILGTVKITPKMLIIKYDGTDKSALARTITIEDLGNSELLKVEEIIVDDPWISVTQIPVDKTRVDLKVSVDAHLIKPTQHSTRMMKSNIRLKIKNPNKQEETIRVLLFLN